MSKVRDMKDLEIEALKMEIERLKVQLQGEQAHNHVIRQAIDANYPVGVMSSIQSTVMRPVDPLLVAKLRASPVYGVMDGDEVKMVANPWVDKK